MRPFTPLLLICTFFVNLAHAQEPLVTDRPDFTESAETVPRGRTQIEAGYTYTRSGDAREHGIGETLVRIAAGDRLEWRLGLPSYLIRRDGARASGFDDSFLGAKYVLRPGVAILGGTTLPTGANAIGEDGYQPEAKLSLAWDLDETTGLGVNFGYVRALDGGQRFNQFLAGASLAKSLAPRWGAYLEAFAFDKADATGKGARYVNTGVTYLINNDFQLDARVGLGAFNRVNGPDYFTGLGVSRRF